MKFKKHFFLSLSFLLSLTFSLEKANAEESVMLVLDVSGSMWGQIEGEAKITIARAALKAMVKDWPKERSVGLIAYGHRSKGDCNDIETVIPVGPLDTGALAKTVDSLMPKGMTPLTASVKRAAEDLKFKESKATVILISDGIETCDLDPCKVGAELEQMGIDFTTHVIGFDVNTVEDQKGLKCLASATGGQFIPASNANELNEALLKTTQAIAAPAPAPVVEKPKILQAEIIAPDSGVKGTEVPFEIKGEKGIEGYLYVYGVGKENSLGYARIEATEDGYAPGKIRLPAVVGEYELKIKDNLNKTVAVKKIKATEAEVSISAPSEVPLGTEVRFTLTAPEGLDGYVYLYKAGKEKSLGYHGVYPSDTGEGYKEGSIRVPAEVGDYELQWKTTGEVVLAKASLKVTEAVISLKAPSEATIGTEVEFIPSGPLGLDGYVYLFGKGKDKSISYERVVEADSGEGYKPGKIRMPTTPGEYELKWKGSAEKVLAEALVNVVKAEISLEFPSEAPIGTELKVALKAPDGLSGYVYLYPAGKDKSLEYVRALEDAVGGYQVAKLRLPAKPGSYDLKWVSDGDGVLASGVVNVISAPIEIVAPTEVRAEEEFSISLKGPAGIDGYLYLFKAGKEQSINYYRVVEGAIEDYEPIRVTAPKEAGEYELKWQINNNQVLGERAIKVNAKE